MSSATATAAQPRSKFVHRSDHLKEQEQAIVDVDVEEDVEDDVEEEDIGEQSLIVHKTYNNSSNKTLNPSANQAIQRLGGELHHNANNNNNNNQKKKQKKKNHESEIILSETPATVAPTVSSQTLSLKTKKPAFVPFSPLDGVSPTHLAAHHLCSSNSGSGADDAGHVVAVGIRNETNDAESHAQEIENDDQDTKTLREAIASAARNESSFSLRHQHNNNHNHNHSGVDRQPNPFAPPPVSNNRNHSISSSSSQPLLSDSHECTCGMSRQYQAFREDTLAQVPTYLRGLWDDGLLLNFQVLHWYKREWWNIFAFRVAFAFLYFSVPFTISSFLVWFGFLDQTTAKVVELLLVSWYTGPLIHRAMDEVTRLKAFFPVVMCIALQADLVVVFSLYFTSASTNRSTRALAAFLSGLGVAIPSLFVYAYASYHKHTQYVFGHISHYKPVPDALKQDFNQPPRRMSERLKTMLSKRFSRVFLSSAASAAANTTTTAAGAAVPLVSAVSVSNDDENQNSNDVNHNGSLEVASNHERDIESQV